MGVLLAFIAFFATVFGILYVFYTTRQRERLALIDKGADASLFNTGSNDASSRSFWSRFSLKTGMFLMGVSIGIITGAILDRADVLSSGADYTSMIFFFGGLSLVLFYLIDKKIK